MFASNNLTKERKKNNENMPSIMDIGFILQFNFVIFFFRLCEVRANVSPPSSLHTISKFQLKKNNFKSNELLKKTKIANKKLKIHIH